MAGSSAAQRCRPSRGARQRSLTKAPGRTGCARSALTKPPLARLPDLLSRAGGQLRGLPALAGAFCAREGRLAGRLDLSNGYFLVAAPAAATVQAGGYWATAPSTAPQWCGPRWPAARAAGAGGRVCRARGAADGPPGAAAGGRGRRRGHVRDLDEARERPGAGDRARLRRARGAGGQRARGAAGEQRSCPVLLVARLIAVPLLFHRRTELQPGTHGTHPGSTATTIRRGAWVLKGAKLREGCARCGRRGEPGCEYACVAGSGAAVD